MIGFDEDLFWGSELDRSHNVVPNWFVELDQNVLGGFFYDLLEITPQHLQGKAKKPHTKEQRTTLLPNVETCGICSGRLTEYQGLVEVWTQSHNSIVQTSMLLSML